VEHLKIPLTIFFSLIWPGQLVHADINTDLKFVFKLKGQVKQDNLIYITFTNLKFSLNF